MYPLLIAAPAFVFGLPHPRLPRFSSPKSMVDHQEHQQRDPAAGAVGKARSRSSMVAVGIVTAIILIVAGFLDILATQVGKRSSGTAAGPKVFSSATVFTLCSFGIAGSLWRETQLPCDDRQDLSPSSGMAVVRAGDPNAS